MKKIASLMLTRFLIIIFLGSSVVGCKKGDNGTPGRDGTNGQDGADGRDGNANVKVDTFTVHNLDWEFNFINVNTAQSLIIAGRAYDRNFSAVTDDVIRNGAVLAFFNKSPDHDGAIAWTPLNFSVTVGYIDYNYGYEVFPGKVKLIFYYYLTSPEGTYNSGLPLPDTKYKIIAIGGSTAGNSSIRKHGITYSISDLKSMSYEQICDVLNLKND